MDTKQVRKTLEARKAQLRARLEKTHRHIFGRDRPVSPNFSEQVKEMENDEVVRALNAEALEELADIDRALGRVDDGSYPRCGRCGGDIGEARLKAVPYTDRCIGCAE